MTRKNWCLQVCADFAGLSPALGEVTSLLSALLSGNAMLLRVLPALYEKQPQPINLHLRELAALMAQLDHAEHHHHLLRLLQIVARKKELGVNRRLGCHCYMLCLLLGDFLFLVHWQGLSVHCSLSSEGSCSRRDSPFLC